MDKKELAVTLKHNGYNCAQAVLCSFVNETGLSEELLKQIGAGFGVGMGCMEATCGALIGAQIIMGLKKYKAVPVLKMHVNYIKHLQKSVEPQFVKI